MPAMRDRKISGENRQQADIPLRQHRNDVSQEQGERNQGRPGLSDERWLVVGLPSERSRDW